jgi:transcriptional regulator with XRE-family HTH domain
VNDIAIGRALRALRLRHGLRQVDVARRARVSQQLISRVERGRGGLVTVSTLRRIFGAVDADAVTYVRWRGGELDGLLDEGHAAIVGSLSTLLQRRGWQVLPEATYSEYGERGSIDVLAWHPSTRTLLVIEVKTEIASAEELLRRHDAKVRLAPKIGLERFGVPPAAVARLLVLGDTRTNRRRVARLAPVFGAAYPASPAAVRRWLRRPDGPLAGCVFVRPGGSARATRPDRAATTQPAT